MQELPPPASYTVDAETLAKSSRASPQATPTMPTVLLEIKARFYGDHYLCDTHTAVAFRVAETGAPTRRC